MRRRVKVFVVVAVLVATWAAYPIPARPKTRSRTANFVTVETVSRSWSPERMRSALPRDAVEATEAVDAAISADGYPFRFVQRRWRGPSDRMPAATMGRVFYTDAGTGIDYSCSGTVVSSQSRSLVWTAGHCVHGGAGGSWHRDWTFVPGYRAGRAPFGAWPAARLGTLNGWTSGSNVRLDIGAAQIQTVGGDRIGDVVGGQGIVFETEPAKRHRVFGYAGAPPRFDGRYLHFCRGPTGIRDDGAPGPGPTPLGMGCNMEAGVSGGAWLKDFDGRAGYVVSVVSYKYGDQPKAVYGPYQGAEALELYRAMSR